MKYALAQDTRIGARKVNQDRIGHWSTSECMLMAVADGLGGHLHGELAAELAVRLLGAAFQREAGPRLADPDAFLVRAIDAGHAAILREAEKRDYPDTPRTVLVACVVQDGVAHWRHVGDSRLYHIREGRILARTRDHTVVQQLIDEGQVREDMLSTHPERNRLLRCLGGYEAPRPDPPAKARLAQGDIVLLCSDGFWSPLTQRQMTQFFLGKELHRAVADLSELAEKRAGPSADNISALAMTWQGEQRAPAGKEIETTQIRDLTATDLDFMRMSDEDIARAIEELKEALRKGQQS
jgi:serine/threonine protein phosphatase PrpC